MFTPDKNLVILAGGASSRMKRSLADSNLNKDLIQKALQVHKALITLGKKKLPLLYYLLQNALQAGYQNIYLIVGENDTHFTQWYNSLSKDDLLRKLTFFWVYQKIPGGYSKPLGTADALCQALTQYPLLQKQSFTVCNGDNLYDVESFRKLLASRTVPHAMMGYDRAGLRFDQQRITKFALIKTDAENYLTDIIEKPTLTEMDEYADKRGTLRVSMNIFSFFGNEIFPYLKDCPLHRERQEKELPMAVRNLLADHPKSIRMFPIKKHLPDLTQAEDIKMFDD
jgi:dTDP-glucose pyrophosphorylase